MNYMKEALDMAKISNNNDDFPVGAVLVKDNEIIAKGYNTREIDNNILGHAEINCIINASKILKSWKLQDCDIYVTLKPCSMCEEVIKQSRINNVFYLVEKPSSKKEYYKTNFTNVGFIVKKEESEEYLKLLNNFFKNKR